METNVAEQQKSNDGQMPQSFGETIRHAEQAIGAGVDKAKESMGTGMENTQQAISDTIGRAKEAASNIASNVTGAAAYVGQKAESATNTVGGAMENTGHYLKNDGLQHITADVTEMIRRNPVPAMLIGIGFGFLLAQASTRRMS